jgi:hypothetical protein
VKSFVHAAHAVWSWGILFLSCGSCLLFMGRFDFVMGRFPICHGVLLVSVKLHPAFEGKGVEKDDASNRKNTL